MNRITLALENDFEGKVIASFDLEEYAKQIRAEVSDKLLSICNSYPNDTTCVDCSFSKWKDNEWNGCEIAQLKEQNNG